MPNKLLSSRALQACASCLNSNAPGFLELPNKRTPCLRQF
jgi:hypothetical protein